MYWNEKDVYFMDLFRIKENRHKLDPTNIFNIAKDEKRIALFELVYYLFCLFFYLYK